MTLTALATAVASLALGTQGQTQRSITENLPLILASTELITSRDRQLVASKSLEEATERALKGRYVLKRFPSFQLAYRETTLGLRDAIRQGSLLQECAKLLAQGNTVLDTSGLSPESKNTLRALVASDGQDPMRVAGATAEGLKVNMGVLASGRARFGSTEATYFVMPETYKLKGAATMDAPSLESQAKTTINEEDRIGVKSSSLTFLYSASTASGIEKLRWTKEAQSFLEQECATAHGIFERARQSLIDGLWALESDRFAKLPAEGVPQFSNLTPEDQHSVLQFFTMGRDRALFPSEGSAENFLRNSQTVEFRRDLVFQLLIGDSAGYRVFNTPVRSPIGP